jgi:hypothetical protein
VFQSFSIYFLLHHWSMFPSSISTLNKKLYSSISKYLHKNRYSLAKVSGNCFGFFDVLPG